MSREAAGEWQRVMRYYGATGVITQVDRAALCAYCELYARARELGGQVSGEHGIGSAKRPYLAESLSPEVRALMRGIKRYFDTNPPERSTRIAQLG